MLTSLVFYPSLGYNLLRNYVQPNRWAWYNRVDETLILGAMPFRSMKQELVQKENVGGVVCCTEEFELKAAYQAMQEDDWKREGVEFFAVPMKDFTGSAPRPQIHEAVEFIESVAAKGKTVYVHCKVNNLLQTSRGFSFSGRPHTKCHSRHVLSDEVAELDVERCVGVFEGQTAPSDSAKCTLEDGQ